MRWWDELAAVVELACESTYRSDKEQRALLRVAHKVDVERWKDTTTNKDRVPPYLESYVDETRRLEDGDQPIRKPSEVKAGKR